MNIDCRVIGDLLPLYADESCSDASRALVDDHLKTCPRCRETLARMKSEQFLPAAQVIDPPAVADYAQKVKHRRQKRGTLLTVGVIVLIVLLSLAAAEKDDRQTLAVCELGLIALQNIKDRYLAKNRIGATGDELQALYALVDVSEDFWKRQPGSLFIDAEAALSKARAEYKSSQERRAA